MVKEYEFVFALVILVCQDIAWVRITMDISVMEDHFSVHLADLCRHSLEVYVVLLHILDIIDVTARAVFHGKYSF